MKQYYVGCVKVFRSPTDVAQGDLFRFGFSEL